jgi:hypothetical protein
MKIRRLFSHVRRISFVHGRAKKIAGNNVAGDPVLVAGTGFEPVTFGL